MKHTGDPDLHIASGKINAPRAGNPHFRQLRRLQLFRQQHPDVIIGDGGFGTIQARIPEPNGEMVVTRYRLDELLDKLDDLTGQQDEPEQTG